MPNDCESPFTTRCTFHLANITIDVMIEVVASLQAMSIPLSLHQVTLNNKIATISKVFPGYRISIYFVTGRVSTSRFTGKLKIQIQRYKPKNRVFA